MDDAIYSSELNYKILELLNKNHEQLQFEASQVTKQYYDSKVFPRALIEISNICAKNCDYCGIQKDNINVERYLMPPEKIIERAKFAKKNGINSLVLQSGEIKSTSFIYKMDEIIDNLSQLEINLTLSFGEQDFKTLKHWKELGAQRYLLRMETFNKNIYAAIHPSNHSFYERIECLENLAELGYQVGTGILVGLPGMDQEDLVFEIKSLLDKKIDMVGLGPLVFHEYAPIFKKYNFNQEYLFKNYHDTLKVISILRILRPEINIAAATALDTFEHDGRIKAIKQGANVIMPNITPLEFRQKYTLYNNKPCIDNDNHECISCLNSKLTKEGYSLAFGESGVPLNYQLKQRK